MERKSGKATRFISHKKGEGKREKEKKRGACRAGGKANKGIKAGQEYLS